MTSMIQQEPVFTSGALKLVRIRVGASGEMPEHHSNFDVVVTVVPGSGTVTVEGTPRPVKAGDVVVMRPRARHAVTAESDLEVVVLHARLAGTQPSDPPRPPTAES